MRDLVDIMNDEESMIKMGMKIKFEDEISEESSDEIERTKSSYSYPLDYLVSEYTLRESHLGDRRYGIV